MSGDIHALSGAYAVDALDDHEREAFERHLAECGDCRAEVDSLREAAAALADTTALTPPAHLRDAVLESITKVRPLPPVVPLASRRPATRRSWLTGSAIAAAVVAVIVIWIQPRTSEPNHPLTVADQVVQAHDVVSVGQHLADGASLVWYRSAGLDTAAVRVTGLPAVATGKTYELWLESRNGVMHPAGLIQGGSRLVALTGAARSAVGAGLTVEPAGGSTSPTLPAVTVAAFPSA